MYLKDTKIRNSKRGAKWNNYADSIIPAWVADMDFPVAHEISEAIIDQVRASDLGYPLAIEDSDLPEIFCQRVLDRFSWNISPKEVLSLTDVVQGLYQSIFTFSNKGDGVIIQTPIYPPFLQSVHEMERRAIINPLKLLDSRYVIDFEDLNYCLEQKPKVLMLCNPHNPCGCVLRREELEKLAEFACRHDLLVLSDEIHADLILDEQPHIPIASIDPEIAARTITFMSASKSFNIAGLCLSFTHFGDKKLLESFKNLPRHISGSHNTLSLTAVETAWTKSQKWLSEVLEQLKTNRFELKNFVDENWPNAKYYPGEATYLAWIDMRSIGPGENMAVHFLEQGKVALSEGEMFGKVGSGFVRLNFATSPEILSEILSRMDRVIRGF